MKVNSAISISGIEFKNPLINGAYIGSKTTEDVEALSKSDCGAIIVGSISVKPRKSNPGQSYWTHRERLYSLNSYGLPNGGIPYYEKHLRKMVKIAHGRNKPLIANIVGFSKEEFLRLLKLAEDAEADMAEFNFGCPNVWDNGKQKQIISYHFSLVKEVLGYISKNSPKISISVKISPLPPDILRDVAKVIVESGIVSAITATNSYPNALTTTGTNSAKSRDEVQAGLAGRSLKPISLGVVRQLKDILPGHKEIIGCGGISSLNDVNDYLSAGAKAVQIASALVDDGLAVFNKILSTVDSI
ncbi:MAG TPA: hypothetical protein VMR34_02735 [Candidatus Saccharimonadales bacterium]|nr:hypothetical protein [Candidatus Saccharimonadales bacterium]